MKLVIFTRTGFHHTSFVNRIQERFSVACVVREAYPRNAKKEDFPHFLVKNLFRQNGVQKVRDEWFLRKFFRTFSAGFRHHPDLKHYLQSPFDLVIERPGTRYLNLGSGEIHSDSFVTFLQELKPDVVAVLGSSVLQSRVISIPSSAIMNLHSGLSPYYRGTWSYGWPIVYGEPEYIGATVHHVNAGIDTGDIIFQTRPRFSSDDDLNTIFLKVISEGMELMVNAIEKILKTGSVHSFKQPAGVGRLRLSRDFHADAARTALSNLEDGIIEAYNAHKEEVDSKVVLYGYEPPKIHT